MTITNSVKYSVNLQEKFEKDYCLSFSDSNKLKKRLECLFVKRLKAGYFATIVILGITLSSFVNLEFDYLLRKNYYEKELTNMTMYTYTYKDAPQAVKEFHENKCIADGITPKDSDVIEITEDTLNELNNK